METVKPRISHHIRPHLPSKDCTLARVQEGRLGPETLFVPLPCLCHQVLTGVQRHHQNEFNKQMLRKILDDYQSSKRIFSNWAFDQIRSQVFYVLNISEASYRFYVDEKRLQSVDPQVPLRSTVIDHGWRWYNEQLTLTALFKTMDLMGRDFTDGPIGTIQSPKLLMDARVVWSPGDSLTMVVALQPGGINRDTKMWYLQFCTAFCQRSLHRSCGDSSFRWSFQLLRVQQGQPCSDSLWLKFANSGTVRTTSQLCQGQGNRLHLFTTPFESNKSAYPILVPLFHFSSWSLHCSGHLGQRPVPGLIWLPGNCLGLVRDWGSQNVTAGCTLTWRKSFCPVIHCILALAHKRNVPKEPLTVESKVDITCLHNSILNRV